MADADSKLCHLCGYRPDDPEEVSCPRDDSWLVAKDEHDQAPDDPLLGHVVAGKYPVVGIIGKGGMGAVYRAVQQPVRREVALKVIRNRGEDSSQVQQRFEKEAEAVAQLTHPNTVTLFDFGVHEDELLYMVLEYVRGRPLTADIRGGPLPVARTCRIGVDVLEALVEAHGMGLVHRDLKPDNIMLTRTTWGTEGVKVLDFGIAKALGGDGGATDRLTQTGMVLGTPWYMAPEQATGKEIGVRTDLYSLGVVLYECLVGRPPFEADNTFELMLAHCQREVPPIPEALEVPEAVRTVVMQALEKEPADRFPDARSMAFAIREAAGPTLEEALGETHQVRAAPLREIPAEEGLAAVAATGDDTLVADAVGGTTEQLASEMITGEARGTARSPAVTVAAVLGTAALAAVGLWALDGDDAAPPAPTAPPEAVPEPARPEPPPPAARAAALVEEGLRLRREGHPEEAESRFDAAFAADAGHAPALYHLAAARAARGALAPSREALEAHLGLAPDRKALAERLQRDVDFDRARHDSEFSAWLAAQGLVAQQATKVKAKTPKKRRKQAARRRRTKESKAALRPKADSVHKAPPRKARKTSGRGVEVPEF